MIFFVHCVVKLMGEAMQITAISGVALLVAALSLPGCAAAAYGPQDAINDIRSNFHFDKASDADFRNAARSTCDALTQGSPGVIDVLVSARVTLNDLTVDEAYKLIGFEVRGFCPENLPKLKA